MPPGGKVYTLHTEDGEITPVSNYTFMNSVTQHIYEISS